MRSRSANPPPAAANLAAYASHSALSHLFNWRQTPVYDPALSRQLAAISGWNDTLLPVLRDNLVKRVQRILTTRWATEDNRIRQECIASCHE